MSAFDLAVAFPTPGSIVVRSRTLFADVDSPNCRRFVERVLQASDIHELTITPKGSSRAELRYSPRTAELSHVVEQVASALRQDLGDPPRPPIGSPIGNGCARPARKRALTAIPPARAARDGRGGLRYYRYEAVITSWRVRSDQAGHVRVSHPALRGKPGLCRSVERVLIGQPGVTSARANALLRSVEIAYDPAQLSAAELLEILDAVLADSDTAQSRGQADSHFGACTAVVPLAAAAQLAVPPLVPLATAACAIAAVPTLRRAIHVLAEERRVGTDALDAIVVLGCLGTMSLLPAALVCWCRSAGFALAARTHERSTRLLLKHFAQGSERAVLLRDGVEMCVPLEQLRPGDTVAVAAGEVVPVDGHIINGFGLFDQEALTGDSSPVARGVGEKVFASTTLLTGRVFVSVEACERATVSAAISRVVDEAARNGTATSSYQRTDRYALPAVVLGGVGLATMDPVSGLAILKSHGGVGMRSAVSYAMLGALALCAQRGVVVKNARALELMSAVDTLVVDGSAIVDPGDLAVNEVVAVPGFTPERVLSLAAAAVQRFHLPVARALCERATESNGDLPSADEVQCRIGQGFRARVEGRVVRVGNRRFVDADVRGLPPEWIDAVNAPEQDGRSIVLVSVDDRLAGAVALEAAVRPELSDVILGLHERGVTRIAIATEDPALRRRASDVLGRQRVSVDFVARHERYEMDRIDRTLCFVGTDNLEACTADVRVSLRADTEAAGDFIVFEGNLTRLCDLRDIARDVERNVERSWALALAPNAACVAGVFAFGLGIMASVIASNAAALAALTNSVLPLRRAARAEAERQHRRELKQRVALERDAL